MYVLASNSKAHISTYMYLVPIFAHINHSFVNRTHNENLIYRNSLINFVPCMRLVLFDINYSTQRQGTSGRSCLLKASERRNSTNNSLNHFRVMDFTGLIVWYLLNFEALYLYLSMFIVLYCVGECNFNFLVWFGGIKFLHKINWHYA